MSWLPNGLFIGDLTDNGQPFLSGTDVPDLEDKLEQLKT